MEPNKDRTGTPCWFESQPHGCRKPHCVFQHSKPRPSLTDHLQSKLDLILPMPANGTNIQNGSQLHQAKIKLNHIENVITKKSEINISIEREDEDSDDPENVTENFINDNANIVKTLEQIRLRKILNSSPVNSGDENFDDPTTGAEEAQNFATFEHRQKRLGNNNSFGAHLQFANAQQEETQENRFVVKTLDQIRKERNGTDKSSDEAENEIPNLLKRSFDFDDINEYKSSNTTRPIKIRRNKSSALSSNVPSEEARKVSQQDYDIKEEKIGKNGKAYDLSNGHSDLLASPINNNSSVIAAELDDFGEIDELMREIDQVINS